MLQFQKGQGSDDMNNTNKKLCVICRHYYEKTDMFITKKGYTCKSCKKRLGLTPMTGLNLLSKTKNIKSRRMNV